MHHNREKGTPRGVGYAFGAACLAASVAVCASARAQLPHRADTPPPAHDEYAVKAGLLYKFAPFVDWPPHAFPTSATPLTVCIAGTDPFGPLADQAMQRQEFGPRGATLRRIVSADADGACHVMFIGPNGGSPISIRHHPILTITDGERSEGEKGIVHLVARASRVRFEIDDHAAQQSGLSISSKLLSLADSVRPRG